MALTLIFAPSAIVSNGTARLNGQSPSKVELSDGRLIVGPPPPGAESVPTENLVWWCDPEVLDAAIVSTDKLDHVRIYGLPDRREGGFAVGKNFLWGAGGRQPWIDRSAHGDGPVRNWIDFSERHREALHKGRFTPHHAAGGYAWIEGESATERVVTTYAPDIAVRSGAADRTVMSAGLLTTRKTSRMRGNASAAGLGSVSTM